MTDISVSPTQVQRLLADGADLDEIARLLVATGTWSEAGATQIVSTLARPAADDASALPDLAWPGPPDDAPPLFAA